MTLAVFGIMRVAPEKVAALLPAIKALAEGTRKNDGCIAYDVAEDIFEPGLFRFSELWPDLESLQKHMTAPHVVGPWREAAAKIEITDRKFEVFDASNGRPLASIKP
jgi:quinol monooxygenase YgiN